jgi:hypothetical protein
MDIIAIVLYSSVAVNLVAITGLMLYIRRSWKLRQEERSRRQTSMVEQAKYITLQQELIHEKEKLLQAYREIHN